MEAVHKDLRFNWSRNNFDLQKLVEQVMFWHYDRNLIDGVDDFSQADKIEEELNELRDSVRAGNSPIDDIGDILVVLINIAERNELTLQECLAHAYSDIRHRKGKIVDGFFVKEA